MSEELQDPYYPTFLAEDDVGEPLGFISVSVRRLAPGCLTSPIGYLEGWYVKEVWRQRGFGRQMVEFAENWARVKGLLEMGSDAEVWNEISITAHGRMGYREVVRDSEEAKFIKPLCPEEAVLGGPQRDVVYRHRVGAYVVCLDDGGNVAVIKTPKGLFLPGGGLEGGENYVECLQRELIEETGHELKTGKYVGRASNYGYAPSLGCHLHTLGVFYMGYLGPQIARPTEVNHELTWVPAMEAAASMFPKSHSWAIQKAMGLSPARIQT
jgi:aminoglycoside 6'-N-acetyltransferase I